MIKKSTFAKMAGSLLLFFFSISLFAQVTTSGISGSVTDNKGEALPGATIVAVHVPSGTKYGTVTDIEGRYVMPAVRVGGPYRISATFVGFQAESVEGVTANLGSSANVNFKMAEDGQTLQEVVVRSSKSDVFSSERTGAATTIGKEAIAALPTVGRSINDFTRLTPQSSGKSFSGQDSRLNNITIDGAVFNNGFGLGDQPGARTGVAPISLDAIEEIQVNVAPYDVRQSGFTGAGVNAVTKSGTNELSGSVFYMTQKNSKTYFGSKVKGEELPLNYPSKEILGFRLGGALVKNKLFFFLNGEFEKFSSPATTWVANRGQSGSNVTRVLASDLDLVSAQMSKLGFETGPYENFNLNTVGNKFLARLDWNINDKHKFNLRYSLLDGGSDQLISNSNSAGFGPRRTVSDAMSYRNSGYIINEDINSLIGELNSTLSNKLANTLIVGFTANNEDRAYFSSPVVPTIDIQEDGKTYISAGFDPFTPNNLLNYRTIQFADNLTYFAGKHTLTAGVAVENLVSNNSFYAASNGVYVFNSVADFISATDAYLTNPSSPESVATLRRFEYRYGFSNDPVPPLQIVKATTPGIYFQDDFQVTPNFKVMAGLRVDVPILEQTALENTYVSGVTFRDENGADVKYNTGVMPSGNPLWSPRLGFNLDVKGDKSLQIRGGSGIFTGRPPFVWLSNQVGNNGVLSGFTRTDNSTNAFTLDPSIYKPAGSDPYAAGTTFDIAVADPNYKFPQVWRTNIAADKKLPLGIIATTEFILNKNINAVYYINANQKPSVGEFVGPDNRPRYNGNSTQNRLDSRIVRNIVLNSTNKGYGYSASIKLEKPFTKGFFAMAAYNFGVNKDLTSAGSIASGSFEGNTTVNGNNFPELSFSDNDQRHRVISSLSYKLNYGGKFGGSTQLSLFYEGRNQGRYSYVYSGDMNQDGISNNDLLFVPAKASDLTFTTLTTGGKTFSPEEQAAAFDAFINQDSYLSQNRGSYTERNGAMLPWIHQVDLGIVQNINVNVANKVNTFQVRFDILNFGNMLNNNWGSYTNFVQNRVLTAVSPTAAGVPQYRLSTQTIDGQTQLIQNSFLPSISTASVWRAQLGLRYIFN